MPRAADAAPRRPKPSSGPISRKRATSAIRRPSSPSPTSIGLDREAARAALGDAALNTAVENLEAEAGRLGIAGVPFFIVNEAWAVSGAQPPETWRDILGKIPAPAAEVHGG